MKMMNSDWLYSEERLKLREQCLKVLLNRYGGSRIEEQIYSTQDIYECADTWISQGNKSGNGIIAFFNAYYNYEDKKGNQVHTQTS